MAQPSGTQVSSAIDEIYLARDDGEGKAGASVAVFLTTDVPIHCVVLLNSDEPSTVRMHLVAVTVSGVRAETKVVSASYTTKGNQNRVNFSGRPDGVWTAGKYRADIYIDNALAGKLDFEIQRSSSGTRAVSSFLPKQSVKPKPSSRKQDR